MSEIQPDIAAIGDFIRLRGLPVQIVSIVPDARKTAARYFSSAESAVKWAAAENRAGKNVYWTVNHISSSHLKKPSKADISHMLMAHADLDPMLDETPQQAKERYLAELGKFEPKPTFIIDSGNGVQPLWKLIEPVEVNGNLDRLEGVNIALEKNLGGDACHNVDRVLRLPGTVNWPDAKKKARGRVPMLAKLLYSGDKAYTLEELPAPIFAGKATSKGQAHAELNPDDLPPAPSLGNIEALAGARWAWLRELIAKGKTDGDRYDSRSEAVWHAINGLIDAGIDDALIASILLDPDFNISDRPREKGFDALRREIAGAHAKRAEKVPPPGNNGAVAEQNGNTNGAAGDQTPLGEWDAGEDGDTVPPRGWLLGNVFCRKFVSSLLADGGVGKTALRYAQLVSLAIGRSLTGEHVFQRCRVLIISLEDDADELRRRILAVLRHFHIDRAELKGWLFLAAPGASGGKLMVDQNGQIVRSALADKLETAVLKHRIDVISLDPFVKSHSVEENANSAVDDVVQLLADMAAKYDCAIDVPHHTSKGLADPGNANRGRGASAMKDGARLVYTLSPMSPEEAQAFGLKEEERRRLVRMDSGKVNIAPPLDAAKWFRLVGVSLGNVTDLYPHGDEVQTVEAWTPPDTWAGLSNFRLNEILTEIDKGLPDGELYSEASRATDRAAWRVVAKLATEKSEGQAREIIRTWLKNGVLVHQEYDSPGRRAKAQGLKVDPAKRPS